MFERLIKTTRYFNKLIRYFFGFCIVSVGISLPSHAADFVMPLYDEDDRYFEYLLRAAIDAADGDHTLKIIFTDLPQSRLIRTLLDYRSEFNVIYTGHSREREHLLKQVDIPLTRGLLGYRVFVIRSADAHLFEDIQSLNDLTKKITVGSGTSWPDTPILRAAGFDVSTGTLENLWQMLAHGRFIAFPRGLSEVHAELKRYTQHGYQVAVTTENTVMIAYPYDQFFYVSPEDEDREQIIEQGLKRIVENGKFDEIFQADPAISATLSDATIKQRRTFNIPNPLNSARVNAIPAKYWHQF